MMTTMRAAEKRGRKRAERRRGGAFWTATPAAAHQRTAIPGTPDKQWKPERGLKRALSPPPRPDGAPGGRGGERRQGGAATAPRKTPLSPQLFRNPRTPLCCSSVHGTVAARAWLLHPRSFSDPTAVTADCWRIAAMIASLRPKSPGDN